jgi:NAD(P)-dependent dehydrogenase (short-subunit alcohol dehydrogenase family)
VTGRLQDKTALITGAGSGLGRASALRFAGEGAAVAVVDRDGAAAGAVAAEIREQGGRAVGIAADVTSARDCEGMTQAAIAELGRLDVVFANAGISGTGSAADLDVAAWDRVIAVNLTGVWLTSRYALPHMLERGSGVVLNQASMGGLIGIPGIFPYTAAKGGVIAMTRQMAVEYGPQGIRVNAILPGTTDTALVRPPGIPDADWQRFKEAWGPLNVEGLHRMAEREEIASAVLALAGNEFAFMTGSSVAVDGGSTAGRPMITPPGFPPPPR